MEGMICLAVTAGLFLGPPVIAALLARWTSSPSSEDLRRGFPVVPLARGGPPPLAGTSTTLEVTDKTPKE